MSWTGLRSNHVWVVPVESGLLEPGDRAAFDCKVGGPPSQKSRTGLWMAPEIEDAFVLEDVERSDRRLRVVLYCIAEKPTAFRGHLYVIFDRPSSAHPEAPS